MVVQLGERQTEDLDVAGSSPAHGTNFFIFLKIIYSFLIYVLEMYIWLILFIKKNKNFKKNIYKIINF